MEQRVADIRSGKADELIWLLEHPPLYTAGTSANRKDLLDAERFPVFETGRGGEFTYHGPGQLVGYVMLDLKKQFAPNPPDIRIYIQLLETLIIQVLAELGVKGERREGRVGIWVTDDKNSTENKIAAIGVRVRKWVTYHGFSLNISPDLSHFNGIVPCGISEYGVTSLKHLGIKKTRDEIDAIFKASFKKVFQR